MEPPPRNAGAPGVSGFSPSALREWLRFARKSIEDVRAMGGKISFDEELIAEARALVEALTGEVDDAANVEGPFVDDDAAVGSTTDALRLIYGSGTNFTVTNAYDALIQYGLSTTKNAVTTALSRGTGRYFERVERGTYRVTKPATSHTALRAARYAEQTSGVADEE